MAPSYSIFAAATILLLLLLTLNINTLTCQATNADPSTCQATSGDPLTCQATGGAENLILGGCGITSIYNFGDSFSDTGNLLVEFPNHFVGKPPYGMTIHKATGRFSDGYLVIDHIAEAAGVPYLNPYLKKNLDQSKGTNFAVAGVGVLSKETRAKLQIELGGSQSSMDIQLQWFHQHLDQTFKDETARRDHLKSSLFVLSGGSSNDYWFIKGQSTSSNPVEKMKAIMPDVFAAIKAYVKKLVTEYGARKLVVTGFYKAGCTADEQRRDVEPVCNTTISAVATLHNQMLKQELQQLRSEFPRDVLIVYGDMWVGTEWILDNYRTAGYQHPNGHCCQCCADALSPCGSIGAQPCCEKPDEYYFWDSNHLTDHTYRVISKFMIPQIAADLGCGGANHPPNKEGKP